MAEVHAIDELKAEAAPEAASPLLFLASLIEAGGNITELLDEQALASIGADCVRDYELDLSDCTDWMETAEKSLKIAAQEAVTPDPDAPSYRRSYSSFPILTTAALQFRARAYPAICRSGNMVKVKVIGSDKGRAVMGDDRQPLVMVNGEGPMTTAQAAQFIAQIPPPAEGQEAPQPDIEPAWEIPPGAKQKRADRVGQYLNVYLEYRVDSWERDTDKLLTQLPIIGCGFRKMRWDVQAGKLKPSYVPGTHLIVPNGVTTLKETPRTTEKLPSEFPFQIRERMNAGFYRVVDLPNTNEDSEHPRLLLEQHRLLDLDQDGVDEPYIVTLDHETQQVLRIEADFGAEDVILADDDETVIRVARKGYYVKYGFLPDPKGGFYDIGFGHLLHGEGAHDGGIGDIINTIVRQAMDAANAQIAGGGFIAAGLRLQGSNRNEVMRWMPGEYKVVNVSGGDLRAGIVERTFPQLPSFMFNLLELMLGAARDITSIKDIVTGEANNNAPVGTTLALLEQGLQLFTAIYKGIYLSCGEEFAMMRDQLAAYGGEKVAEDYDSVLDDPEANFAEDFADTDTDIKPVADPTSVTRMQQMAKAQFMMALRGTGLNDLEIDKFAMETAGIPDIDRFLPQGQPQPDPLAMAKVRRELAMADASTAKAGLDQARTMQTVQKVGHEIGEADGYAQGALRAA